MARTSFHRLLPVLLACAGAARSWAQAPTNSSDASRPAAAGRIVRLFDFEEQSTNPNPVPRFWTRNQDQDDRPRPGFPRFNSIELDELQDEPAASRGCVRLSTRGGSTSLQLDAGVIPVFREADYLVGARVRTDGLVNARAAVAVRFLDEHLKPITGSERVSKLVVSQGKWSNLAVDMHGDFPTAAFVQIELLLLQPDKFESPTQVRMAQEPAPAEQPKGRIDSSIELRKQDLSGAAYFDDVSVVQLPRLELSTQTAANIIAAPVQPTIQLLVRDLTGEALTGKLVLLDAASRTVDTKSISVGEGRSRTSWTPALPGYGWYRAVLDMSNSVARVGATYLDFAWLPPVQEPTVESFGPGAANSRFWLLSRDVPQATYGALAAASRDARSSGLSLPVWTLNLTPAMVPERSGALRPLVDAFRSERLDLAFSLPIVPESATDPKALVPPDPWTLITQQQNLAHPLLDEFLDDYGQTVQRWQIGWFSAKSAGARSAFGADFPQVESMLGKLVPGPIIQIPAPLEDFSSLIAAAAKAPALEPAVYMPYDALPASCGMAVELWRNATVERPFGRLLAALGSAPDSSLDATDAAASLAKRAVRVWAAASGKRTADGKLATGIELGLVDPWTTRPDLSRQLMPRPELAAWRAIIDRLRDRRFVCEFPLASGGEAFLFSARGAEGGLLVLWNDAASPDQVKLTNYLGAGPISISDVFGNLSPLADPSHSPLAISSTPVFIEGVDSELLHFVSTFSIDPPLLSMTAPETQHNVRVTNTWSVPISATMYLLEPGGLSKAVRRDRTWRINPRNFTFALAPGETATLPMTVSFGTAEEVGTKPFVFSVDLSAGHSYETFRVSTNMELGLRDLSFSVTATPRGDDLVLEATISNQSRSSFTLAMTAFPPDMPRQLVDVGEVLAGNQVIHRFTLKNVYPAHKGKRIPIAISDTEAGVRINRSVLIP
ncbi:MAG: hypothetical protein JSS51_02865 [Planctomycetes bacterium]|nr:hypothetical protein [Planctomycetota bacterium]